MNEDLRAANERYASGFANRELPAAPARRIAIVTCMDARLDPAKFLGLDEGDAHVIRNAGAVVTDDVLRSLAISHHLLGTQEVLVVAHEDCGMLTFTNAELRERIGTDVDFHPFADLDESVREGVRRIRESPLLPPDFRATGHVYDVRTGRVRDVA